MPRVRPLPTSEGNPRSGESPNKYSLIRNVQTISRRYYYTSDRRPSRAHDGSVQPRPKSSPPNPGWYRHKLLCPDVYIIALCATQCQPGCENFWNEAVLGYKGNWGPVTRTHSRTELLEKTQRKCLCHRSRLFAATKKPSQDITRTS